MVILFPRRHLGQDSKTGVPSSDDLRRCESAGEGSRVGEPGALGITSKSAPVAGSGALSASLGASSAVAAAEGRVAEPFLGVDFLGVPPLVLAITPYGTPYGTENGAENCGKRCGQRPLAEDRRYSTPYGAETVPLHRRTEPSDSSPVPKRGRRLPNSRTTLTVELSNALGKPREGGRNL